MTLFIFARCLEFRALHLVIHVALFSLITFATQIETNQRNMDPANRNDNVSIVIVGAGIAGLTAASTLVKSGFKNVIVLEAEERIGGRAHSLQNEDGSILELGAGGLHYTSTAFYKFCDFHGFIERDPVTNASVNDDDHNSSFSNFDLIFSEDHKPLPNDAREKVVKQSRIVLDRGESDGKNRTELQESTCDYNSSKCSVGDYIPEIYTALKQKLQAGNITDEDYRLSAAGIDLGIRWSLANEGASSTEIISRIGNSEETGSGSYYTRLSVPLTVVVSKLRENIPDENIWLKSSVQNISFDSATNRQQQKRITISYVKNGSAGLLYADHVIFTGSVGVLKAKHSSLFTSPPLSDEKQKVISLFGFGNLGKLFFKYPIEPNGKTWWQNNLAKWNNFSIGKFDPYKSSSLNMVWLNDGENTCEPTSSSIDGNCTQIWTRQISALFFLPTLLHSGSALQTTQNGSHRFERTHNWCLALLPGSVSNQVDQLDDAQVLVDFNAYVRDMIGDASVPDAERVLRRRWSLQPNYYGTYSHSSVGCAREFGTSGANVLAKPEWWYNLGEETTDRRVPGLMFAGEATFSQGLGYMHGAFATGLREAERIISAYSV